jgi:ubiquinone/menaquinone biosynthesis C-methylase UbiE
MDYDRTEIAATYDRARGLAPERARLWRDLLSAYADQSAVSLVLDLGCGTGRFSVLLAEHFGVLVIGIDPSRKMLDQARRKPAIRNVVYQQGSAEALPLRDGSIDLVFMSNVYHHLNDPSAVLRECRRVLREGGYVCMRNGTRDLDFPQRRFFPALDPLVASEIPSRGDIEASCAAAGFTRTVHRIVTEITAPDWPTFVEKSALRADSFLARLSDKDFQKGMAAMRSATAVIDRDSPVREEIDWFVFRRLGPDGVAAHRTGCGDD